jgi:acyl-coenzyme A thioesterase PaaI-like protein
MADAPEPSTLPGPDWAERFNEAREQVPDARRREMRRVADAARGLIERLVATRAPEEALARAAALLEEALAELAGHPQGRVYEGFAESANAGDPHAFFDHSPIIGHANPLAPPLRLSVVDGRIHGEARFGAAYEGPPGAVHGGYVAAAFDEVLGMAQSLGGTPGMTGTLSIRYRRPTPLHTDLRFEASLDRKEGRKLFTTGRLYAGDELCAQAEGLFITVDFAKIAEMMATRQAD